MAPGGGEVKIQTTHLHLTGEQLKDSILDLALRLGYRRAAFRPGRLQDGSWRTPVQGDKGFPDVVLAKAGQPLLLIECKGDKEPMSPAQEAWRIVLGDVPGITYILARPDDWWDGRIESELR